MNSSHGAKYQSNSFFPLIILKGGEDKRHRVTWRQPAMVEDRVVTGVWNARCSRGGGKKGCWRSLSAVQSEFNLNHSEKCLATSKHLSKQSSTLAVAAMILGFFHLEQRPANYSSRAKGTMRTRSHPVLYGLIEAASWRAQTSTCDGDHVTCNAKIFPISSFKEKCLLTPYLRNPEVHQQKSSF